MNHFVSSRKQNRETDFAIQDKFKEIKVKVDQKRKQSVTLVFTWYHTNLMQIFQNFEF